jgi:uroporphyrinogen-III decarboxylase
MAYTQQQKEHIKRLAARQIEICASEKNKKNNELWNNPKTGWNRDMWRGDPKPPKNGKIPYTLDFDNSLMSCAMDTDLWDYYSDPYVHLETQLRCNDYHFTNWHDNHCFTEEVFIWFGVVTELSFFGPEIIYFPHREPWIKESIVKSSEDIERIGMLDFHKSGSMPKLIEYYEKMNELLDGRLTVMFPAWARGPFCISAHLLGLENMLVGMMTEPEFAHKLMRYVTDNIKQWSLARNKFIGEENLVPGKLYNDEIDVPTMSAEMYEEFVLPYEIELSEFFGGIRYWHSCGKTTEVMKHIVKIPKLELFHVSPWADEKTAVQIMSSKNISLDICLDPERDLYFSSDDKIRRRLIELKDNCEGVRWAPRFDAFQPRGDLRENLELIKRIDRIACEVYGDI